MSLDSSTTHTIVSPSAVKVIPSLNVTEVLPNMQCAPSGAGTIVVMVTGKVVNAPIGAGAQVIGGTIAPTGGAGGPQGATTAAPAVATLPHPSSVKQGAGSDASNAIISVDDAEVGVGGVPPPPPTAGPDAQKTVTGTVTRDPMGSGAPMAGGRRKMTGAFPITRVLGKTAGGTAVLVPRQAYANWYATAKTIVTAAAERITLNMVVGFRI